MKILPKTVLKTIIAPGMGKFGEDMNQINF
jgi:hypothetical protein